MAGYCVAVTPQRTGACWRPQKPHRLEGRADTQAQSCRQRGARTSSEQDTAEIKILKEYLYDSSLQNCVKKMRPEA